MSGKTGYTLGAIPAEPEIWRRPLCKICQTNKAKNRCNRGGKPTCNGCKSRLYNMLSKTPREIHKSGEQAWVRLCTVVHALAGETAANRLPKFDEALPLLFTMKEK